MKKSQLKEIQTAIAKSGMVTLNSVTDEQKTLFETTTGIPLRQCWYLSDDLDLGFDVIKFDKLIKTPDGVSTRQHLMRNYSDEFYKLIVGFLS
jgi:hypothetical protein